MPKWINTTNGTSGVYVILGPKDRAYVGSSKNCETRLDEHVGRLNRGAHPLKSLQRDWDEYGSEAFRMSLIEELPLDRKLLFAAEGKWLRHYWTLPGGIYNSEAQVVTAPGFKHKDQMRRKRSKYMLENSPWKDPVVQAKIHEKQKDVPRPKSVKDAIKAKLTGRVRDQKFRDACAKGQTGRKHSEESKQKRRKPHTPEAIERMSVAMLAYWAKRRKDESHVD